MIKKQTYIIIFLTMLSFGLNAQEYLSGISINTAVNHASHSKVFLKSQVVEVRLPFLDDFSNTGNIYPVDTLWADHWVFVNSGYPVNPPSIGVATFDAIDDTGAVYLMATPTPFIADYLTSQPIRLDSLFSGTPGPITPADSVYLSFYYQPQGVADAPSPEDSLVLEFFSPADSVWRKAWGSPGITLTDFYTQNQTYFKQVMIAITDTQYFKNDFRFRFKNYASIATSALPSWQSNVDQWNVDYIYLNTGRNKNDTVYPDITFVDPAPSILKNYMQMPARQFINTELKDTLRLKMSNLNDVLNNISYQYVVQERNGPYNYTKSGGVWDILPFITNGYHTYPLHTRPAVDFSLPSMAGKDSVTFDVTHMIGINGWGDHILNNDTISYAQEFCNYYAYDDGSAENGYGLAGMNAKLAYRFSLNNSDTLGGVKFYFNQTLSSPFFKYFYIMVWSSLEPEVILYKSKRMAPQFGDSINAFVTYPVDDTTLILSGTFFIGWQQTSDDNLNVGYDRNTNSKTLTFFNVDGTWTSSAFDGSLMIRPVMGTSWQAKSKQQLPSSNDFLFVVYPNPAQGNEINIDLPENYNTFEDQENTVVEIFDLTGRRIKNLKYAQTTDISFLNKGVYFIRLTNFFRNEASTSRLVITR